MITKAHSMTGISLLAVACVALSVPALAVAQTRPAATPSTDAATRGAADLTVAVLDFDGSTGGNPELGRQVAEALAAMLSGEEGFTLVDRASLTRALQEQELSASGLVDSSRAAKIGQVVGAKILVTGKVFPLDKQIYVTAKIIGTETSLVEGVLVKAEQSADVGTLVEQLSGKVAQRLREIGPNLIAPNESERDPVLALVARLAGRTLPKLAVRVPERHLAGSGAGRIDPAVETEIIAVLKQAGFAVAVGDDKDLTRERVELVISGEAFSEFAARIGNLVSCSARVEVKLQPLNGGEILFTDRQTTRAADLSENIAAKSALEKGGRAIAVRLLEHFETTLPPGGDGDNAPATAPTSTAP